MNAPAAERLPSGPRPSLAVSFIVLAQCLSTSLWFSPSGMADSLATMMTREINLRAQQA